jgi:hypothetical protein
MPIAGSSLPHLGRRRVVTVSQETWDDLVRENADCFDLSHNDAVTETLEQLVQQQQGNVLLMLRHVSTQANECQRIQQFQSALQSLRTSTTSNDDVLESLTVVQSFLNTTGHDDDDVSYPHLFVMEQGWSALWNLWSRQVGVISVKQQQLLHLGASVLRTWLVVAGATMSSGPSLVETCVVVKCPQDPLLSAEWYWLRRQFQQQVPAGPLCTIWLATFQQCNEDETIDLLWWLYASLYQNETAKKEWMRLEELPKLLVKSLDPPTEPHSDDERILLVTRIVITLCTYEENQEDDSELVVSSAHSHVQRLVQAHALEALHALLQKYSTGSLDVVTGVLGALRSLAIQDVVVQKMAASGVLETTRQVLQQQMESDPAAILPLATATVGLWRNVCANDVVKTRLCSTVVPILLPLLTKFPMAASLQEHALAMFGAMALRAPANAAFLVEAGIVPLILAAIYSHPHRATLQRQAALCVRNLASRSPQLRPVLRDAGLDVALREISARHVACQDEVYAALRDMDAQGNLLLLTVNDANKLQAPATFGQRNSNFRPVYD